MYQELTIALAPGEAHRLLIAEESTSKTAESGHEEGSRLLTQERRETALIEAKNIAQSEFARRRKRLGTLTPEQEIALENLLISTVTKVSELTGKAMEALPVVA